MPRAPRLINHHQKYLTELSERTAPIDPEEIRAFLAAEESRVAENNKAYYIQRLSAIIPRHPHDMTVLDVKAAQGLAERLSRSPASMADWILANPDTCEITGLSLTE